MSFEQHPGFVCRFPLLKEMVLKKRKSFIGRKKYRKQLRQLFNEWRKTYPDGYVEIAFGVARGDSRATLRIIS